MYNTYSCLIPRNCNKYDKWKDDLTIPKNIYSYHSLIFWLFSLLLSLLLLPSILIVPRALGIENAIEKIIKVKGVTNTWKSPN